MLIGQEVIVVVFIVVANGSDIEEFDIVCEGNPETSIVLVLKVDLALREVVPLFRLVAPGALPLFLTPGIPNLNQSFGIAFVVERYQFCTNQTVCMGIH